MRTVTPSKTALQAWVHLFRIHALVTRCAEKRLKAKGITLPQFEVLAQLGSLEGCCTQEVLCDKLLVTKGNVSLLVSRLVEDGLVSRTPDPEDRRCNRVALTEKGRTLYQELVPDHEACLEEMFAGLHEKEQGSLEGLLAKLWTAVKSRSRCAGSSDI
jgi:DNA-binding MarR family transcriptional regulator